MNRRNKIGRSQFQIAIAANATHNIFKSYLRRHLQRAHVLLAPPLSDLSIALVGDKKMADLHLRSLKIPGPTDVLTFPLNCDKRGRPLSGEVVICVPQARRICRQTGGKLREELLLYALHGMLHLCGYDDKTDRGYRQIHRMEDAILIQIGVGPVFAAGAAGRGDN